MTQRIIQLPLPAILPPQARQRRIHPIGSVLGSAFTGMAMLMVTASATPALADALRRL